jgi:hypothetical protein
LDHERSSLKVRPTATGLVPYLETSLADAMPGVIAEVVVGPSAHPELARRALEQLLETQGYDAAGMVRHSLIPLRV